MIATPLGFKVIDHQWHVVTTGGQSVSGPHVRFEDAIQARNDLARVDVTATAEKVSARRQRQIERQEAGH